MSRYTRDRKVDKDVHALYKFLEDKDLSPYDLLVLLENVRLQIIIEIILGKFSEEDKADIHKTLGKKIKEGIL